MMPRSIFADVRRSMFIDLPSQLVVGQRARRVTTMPKRPEELHTLRSKVDQSTEKAVHAIDLGNEARVKALKTLQRLASRR